MLIPGEERYDRSRGQHRQVSMVTHSSNSFPASLLIQGRAQQTVHAWISLGILGLQSSEVWVPSKERSCAFADPVTGMLACAL